MTSSGHIPVEGDRARVPRAPTPADAPAVEPTEIRRILKLQRLAGNTAVRRLLCSPTPATSQADLQRALVQRNGPTIQEQATAVATELQPLIDGATWKEIRKGAYPKESAAGIKRAKERKTGARPDLTGLGKIKTLDNFAAAIHAIQTSWATKSPDERAKALGAAISAELTANDVPGFIQVRQEKTEFKGSFQQGGWIFNISKDLVETSPLSNADAAELANTGLHEGRHAEQAFLSARFAAGVSKKTDAALAAEVDIPEPIAKEANKRKFDAKTDAGVADLGKSMYKAMVTEGVKNQKISDDDGLRELKAKRAEAIIARTNVLASATDATVKAAKTARDALRAQIADVEKRYTAYRNIPYEADAHEVGDAAEQAFKGWP